VTPHEALVLADAALERGEVPTVAHAGSPWEWGRLTTMHAALGSRAEWIVAKADKFVRALRYSAAWNAGKVM